MQVCTAGQTLCKYYTNVNVQETCFSGSTRLDMSRFGLSIDDRTPDKPNIVHTATATAVVNV